MRQTLMLAVLTALVALSGCGASHDARQFIHPNTDNGKTALAFLPSDAKLRDAGRISGHTVLTSYDGVDLDLWWIHPTDTPAKGTVVLLHGLGESKANLLGVGEKLAAMGYDVVLPDLRFHGRSGGAYVTHGVREKNDVKQVVDTLVRRGQVHPRLFAAGTNLGAAVALQYAAIEPRVEGVMAVDAYTDLESYVNYAMRLRPAHERAEAMEEIRRAANFNVADASAIKAVRSLKIPLLFAYGVLDRNVPKEHTQQMFAEASEPKDLVLVEPLSLMLTWQQWMADQIDRLATTGLKKP